MAVEFNDRVKKQFEDWLGGGKRFQLLYSADRDGCDPKSFHDRCDNKGPTITVIYNAHGSMYGGYTSMSWQSIGGSYVYDQNAFLFSAFYNNVWKPQQFPAAAPANAIYNLKGFGPTFGSGHDIAVMNGALTKTGGVYKLFKVALASAYNMQGNTTINNGTNECTNFEVYSVFDGPRELEQAWRTTGKWNDKFLEALKHEVEEFAPVEELKVPQSRILLVGPIGAGKSSFFNTISSIFRGYVTSQACSGSAEHSLTTKYRMYQVRSSATGKPLNMRLCDTRGLEEGQGLDSHEINFILDGNVPEGYQFNPSVPISADIPGFISGSHLKNKIHCACFVVDGSTVECLPEKILEKMKSLQVKMNNRGIPQVVLLTKVDKVCALVEEDVSMVFKSEAVRNLVDKVSQILGLPRGHILPIKNYEKEIDLDRNVSILAFLTLRQILRYSLDYMFNFLDHDVSCSDHGPTMKE